MNGKIWTKEEDAIVRKIWHKPGSLKAQLRLFDDRTYEALLHRGRTLKLGPRQNPSRATGWGWDVIKAELEKGPGTAPDILRRTGLARCTVSRLFGLAEIGPEGEIHISDYEKRSTGGKPIAVYSIGPGENAAIPAPYTDSEKYHMIKARQESKSNPFSIVLGQVLNAPEPKRTVRGRYESHVYRMEAA